LFALAPSQNRINGMGTGSIIDPRGYVVTNQHVVEDVSSLHVCLVDGTTLAARVVAATSWAQNQKEATDNVKQATQGTGRAER
jgi:S1-C subfamily serine protease